MSIKERTTGTSSSTCQHSIPLGASNAGVALAPSQALPTDAIAFIDGRRVLLLIPRGELEREAADLRFRVMTFVHEPDDPSGTAEPSMADVFPPLDQPLQTFGLHTVPLG